MATKNKIKPLCFAPWIHTHVQPDGTRALCCHSRPFPEANNIENQDFETFWNSTEINEIRKTMLEGRLPEEYCLACINSEGHTEAPYHHYQAEGEDWKNLKAPSFLDYRLGNFCNLSCRTCNESYSSKIENISHKVLGSDPNQNTSRLLDLKRKEFIDLSKNENLNRLYFAHGEPLLQKDHWDFLESLSSDPKKASKIELEYNSNLCHEILFQEKNRSIHRAFKKVGISVSLDGAQGVGEFIRDGLDWNRVVKNFEKLKNDSLYDLLSIEVTLTLPLLLDIKPLCRFLLDQKVSYNIQKINPGGYSNLLSPGLLPKKIQKIYFLKAIEDLKSVDNKNQLIEFHNFLKEYLAKGFDEISRENLSTALKFSKKFDEAAKRVWIFDFYQSENIIYQHLKEILDSENFK